jgi:hypothetical protein
VATARFLAEADVARSWQAVRLLSSLEQHEAHLSSRAAAAVTLFGGLGYHPPYPANLGDAAGLLVTDEARLLREADLYIIAPEMCDVVLAAAATLTVPDLRLLTKEDLPSQTGAVMLPYPVLTRTISGELSDLRAFAWRTPAAIAYPDPRRPRRIVDTPAVRISSFTDTYGPVQPESFREVAARARAARTPLPPWSFDGGRCFPLDFDFPEDAEEQLRAYAATARRVGAELREEARAVGVDDGEGVVGEYVPGSEIADTDDTFVIRFLYAFWRLCEQRIATTGLAEINHSARVLAERSETSPEVRVVLLRQLDRENSGGAAGGRDWQHRWVVRMHKVRQWYPSLGRHRVIYRGPYIKGPEDKPLIGGETVRGLIR